MASSMLVASGLASLRQWFDVTRSDGKLCEHMIRPRQHDGHEVIDVVRNAPGKDFKALEPVRVV